MDAAGTGTELARLTAVEREYHVTMRVLAVMAERLLALTGGEFVAISDDALADSPDLHAWRNNDTASVLIEVSR